MSGKAESTSYGADVKGKVVQEGAGALVLPEGRLYFGIDYLIVGYKVVPLKKKTDREPEGETFSGEGQSLRKKK